MKEHTGLDRSKLFSCLVVFSCVFYVFCVLCFVLVGFLCCVFGALGVFVVFLSASLNSV